MSENNKTYRIRTKIGVTENSPVSDKYLTVNLTEKVDTIEIMSLKIKQENAYKFHSADYGVVVGRAIANGGFGVPNVKVSVFIAADQATQNDAIYNAIYPYTSVTKKNKDNIRYNLLPDAADDDCYQVVGTFPNKRLVLDDDNYMEIYDKYYKFTTRTNNAGDYMIFGIPTGGQILHFDTDLSDVGILSQRPRDMIYKGYNINQFENANQFKVDDNLANLPQIISQDDSVYVYPFWGDESENIIGITRHDIDINYKFEPTCVFMGSIVSDSNSNHISKKCIPTEAMGMMEEMITGSGTIEMIRKKQDGTVEQFNIQGTQLINDNGVWCYQIPMNLDYAMTDEYGNLVPSDDPTKGIATRTSVRFRFSMQDFENDSANSFRTKVLVPNNPQNSLYQPDYVFGSFTEEESFRDLLWNNVYTVKSFIPRFQKGNGNRNRRFSGIKQCNYHGQNNPIPYNNMRINLSFQFVITCLIVKLLVWAIGIYNAFITAFANAISKFVNSSVMKAARSTRDWLRVKGGGGFWKKLLKIVVNFLLGPLGILIRAVAAIGDFFDRMVKTLSCVYIDGEMCEQLEGSWYFAPNCGKKSTINTDPNNYVWKNMMGRIEGKKMDEMDFSSSSSKNGGGMNDKRSIDSSNADSMNDEESMVTIKYTDGDEDNTGSTYSYVISRGINYFLQCIEISLAQEFRVVQFDFYNDWINGMVYIPRWERSIKKKRRFFLFGKAKVEVRACNDNYTKRFFERKNRLTEQCGVSYKARTNENSVSSPVGCKNNKKYKCHKKKGRKQIQVFQAGGVVHSEQTSSGLYAYYFKPCEYITNRNAAKNRKVNLFATDIVLLGSLVDCDINGTPVFTNELASTTYQLPSPLAHTDSTEEGFTYEGEANSSTLLSDPKFTGIFDYSDSILNPKDDGSVTEESGIDWGYTGPGQGTPNKPKTYTPGGHFLGISCVNAESSIKSCVNLKRVCEIGVWPSQRQEIFNGYDSTLAGTYLDIIPNGLISRDDISGGNFRKLFSTMNKNNLRTKVNASGFTVYDFEYMSPENFGGEMYKYSRANYNEANPLSDEAMDHYLAKNPHDKDEDGVDWVDTLPSGTSTAFTESESLSLKPIRRSLDDRDNDYMRFRLGLESGSNSEIQTKYLGSDDYGFYMPVYNNSFYFYFGLIPGSTAIEEFHKQFFAECKHTMSTEDLRLNISLSYKNYDIEDVFAASVGGNITISIFESGATTVLGDSLKIFSTAIPIKIVVDGDINKTITLGAGSEAEENAAYLEFSYSTGDTSYKNLFDLEIGKHTVSVTDSDGRTVTKLIEVVRQEITICPDIAPIDFTDENYIINSTARLVNGNLESGNRESLGGWFNFEWDGTRCPNTGDCSTAVFKYTDKESGAETCVKIDDCLLLFAGMGKIIKVGDGESWSDSEILSHEEFAGYATPFSGTVVNSSTTHIYAGEATNYSLYVLYKKDNDHKTPSPILIEDGLEIGEPDAIDFDIFREVVNSEEDSMITFRNPLIKIWHKYPTDWYKHLYDIIDGSQEISYDQIWYIRKNSFYVVSASTIPDGLNEGFTSDRTLYINPFYPVTVGKVNSIVSGSQASTIRVTGESAWNIYLTGVSINEGTGAEIPLRTPPVIFGSGLFKFPVFYKPYYYKAVIWEGYSVFEIGGNRLSYGHVYGKIYNGIVYDEKTDTGFVQKFGPTMLNDMYNISDSVSVSQIINDFDNGPMGRVTEIAYDNSEITLSEATNSLLITEGAPKYYNGEYIPVEYSLETSTIGGMSSWSVSMDIVSTGSTQSANSAKLTVYSEDVVDSGIVNCLFATNKPLDRNRNITEVIETIDSSELTGGSGYELKNIVNPAEGVSFNLPFSRFGSGSINEGVILMENVVMDNWVYSPTDRSLGFLSSRNFIRNGMTFNYSLDDDRMEFIVKYGSCLPRVGLILSRNPETIYIKNPFSDTAMRKKLGNAAIDEIVVTLPGLPVNGPVPEGTQIPPDIGEKKDFKLIEDYGYDISYSNGYYVLEVSETNGDLTIDEDLLLDNDFYLRLFFMSQLYFGNNNYEIPVKISVSNLGDGGIKDGVPYKDDIDSFSATYISDFILRSGEPEEDDD